MTIVEALLGSSIEEVAKAVSGERYICNFNDFEIDGTKYQNPEQIVDAYNKHLEEKYKRFLETKKQQEQLGSSNRNQQIGRKK